MNQKLEQLAEELANWQDEIKTLETKTMEAYKCRGSICLEIRRELEKSTKIRHEDLVTKSGSIRLLTEHPWVRVVKDE